jgi:hypothetical protein
MVRVFRPVVRLVVCGLLALTVLSLPVGCGTPKGHVSGKVLLADGSPLPGGTITFLPQQGKNVAPVMARIGEDGTYDAPGVPVGPSKVTISNAELDPNASDSIVPTGANSPAAAKMPPQMKSKMSGMGPPKGATEGKDIPGRTKPPGTYVPLDPKYSSPETSGLTCDVHSGSTPFDVTGILTLKRKK